MLQHETQEVSDQAVTRLAMALYEADQEAARKKQALEQAAAEIGVPPHYLELAREQLARVHAGPQHQSKVGRRQRSPVLAFLAAFATAVLLMGGIYVFSRSELQAPDVAVRESTPAERTLAPPGPPSAPVAPVPSTEPADRNGRPLHLSRE